MQYEQITMFILDYRKTSGSMFHVLPINQAEMNWYIIPGASMYEMKSFMTLKYASNLSFKSLPAILT
jgi:hypothetical protein